VWAHVLLFLANREIRPTSVVFQDEDGNALYTQPIDEDRIHNQKVSPSKTIQHGEFAQLNLNL
jgi:hypothetical protein